MRQLFLIAIMLLSAQVYAQSAAQCSKSSGPQTVALLELYSSEGCSSCPPADNFVRQLYQTTGLNSDQVIPLALHVDYWDYIGWKDPYAKALHTDRQRFLASVSGSKNIYTPEFFLNGQEYRPSRRDVVQSVKAVNAQPARANIHIELHNAQKNQLPVKLSGSATQTSLLFAALVESGLSGAVNAGENSGVVLHHDAVLRTWGAPIELAANTPASRDFMLSIPADAVSKNLSVLAFVQNQQGQILQALTLPLCQIQ